MAQMVVTMKEMKAKNLKEMEDVLHALKEVSAEMKANFKAVFETDNNQVLMDLKRMVDRTKALHPWKAKVDNVRLRVKKFNKDKVKSNKERRDYVEEDDSGDGEVSEEEGEDSEGWELFEEEDEESEDWEVSEEEEEEEEEIRSYGKTVLSGSTKTFKDNHDIEARLLRRSRVVPLQFSQKVKPKGKPKPHQTRPGNSLREVTKNHKDQPKQMAQMVVKAKNLKEMEDVLHYLEEVSACTERKGKFKAVLELTDNNRILTDLKRLVDRTKTLHPQKAKVDHVRLRVKKFYKDNIKSNKERRDYVEEDDSGDGEVSEEEDEDSEDWELSEEEDEESEYEEVAEEEEEEDVRSYGKIVPVRSIKTFKGHHDFLARLLRRLERNRAKRLQFSRKVQPRIEIRQPKWLPRKPPGDLAILVFVFACLVILLALIVIAIAYLSWE
ncbi:hypothetical protein lerEdw1_011424 [Lerista edwardsae]|nr:hypothetical protein lerEdw1_011424 [Lerista edwardsae]